MKQDLITKLHIPLDSTLLLLHAPERFETFLMQIKKIHVNPEHGNFTSAIIFISSQKELEEELSIIQKVAKHDRLLWICYPKATGSIKTNINRDSLRAYLKTYEISAVTLISLDDTWSAMRCRPDKAVGH